MKRHEVLLYTGFGYLSLILFVVGAGMIYAVSSSFHRRRS